MLRQVLRAVGQPQLVAVDQGLHAAQVGERRQHRDVDLVEVLVRQRERDLLHQRDRLEVVEVHLPVAGDQRLAAHGDSRAALQVIQHFDAGQCLALKVFQRRPATGGNVREAVLGQAQLPHRGGRVAAADDAERALGGRADDRLGDALGARRERRELEHAHRAVPEDGLGVGQQVGEPLHRTRADVQAHLAVGDAVGRAPSPAGSRP